MAGFQVPQPAGAPFCPHREQVLPTSAGWVAEREAPSGGGAAAADRELALRGGELSTSARATCLAASSGGEEGRPGPTRWEVAGRRGSGGPVDEVWRHDCPLALGEWGGGMGTNEATVTSGRSGGKGDQARQAAQRGDARSGGGALGSFHASAFTVPAQRRHLLVVSATEFTTCAQC